MDDPGDETEARDDEWEHDEIRTGEPRAEAGQGQADD
jgi:hypothetical protein